MQGVILVKVITLTCIWILFNNYLITRNVRNTVNDYIIITISLGYQRTMLIYYPSTQLHNTCYREHQIRKKKYMAKLIFTRFSKIIIHLHVCLCNRLATI